MRMVWILPVTLVVLGVLIRAGRRRRDARPLTTEPVSGQWLAEARSREEHPW